MAVINYSDQFKYSGKGYIDAKAAPVANLEALTSISSFVLAKYYVPGMVVLVLDDGLGEGPAQYVLNEAYEWEKLGGASVDLTEVEARIGAVEQETVSLGARISEIAAKADTNASGIESLSERISKIAGIDKLKAGENVSLTTDADGNTVISVALTGDETISTEINISSEEFNVVEKKEDGLYAQGVIMDGDDLENEIGG